MCSVRAACRVAFECEFCRYRAAEFVCVCGGSLNAWVDHCHADVSGALQPHMFVIQIVASRRCTFIVVAFWNESFMNIHSNGGPSRKVKDGVSSFLPWVLLRACGSLFLLCFLAKEETTPRASTPAKLKRHIPQYHLTTLWTELNWAVRANKKVNQPRRAAVTQLNTHCAFWCGCLVLTAWLPWNWPKKGRRQPEGRYMAAREWEDWRKLDWNSERRGEVQGRNKTANEWTMELASNKGDARHNLAAHTRVIGGQSFDNNLG